MSLLLWLMGVVSMYQRFIAVVETLAAPPIWLPRRSISIPTTDDWVDQAILEKEFQFLDENPEIDCVWCDYIQADTLVQGDGFETFLLSHLPQMTLEHACGAMFRKSVWEELGGYDEELDYQEAFDFWCRFHDEGYRAQRLEIPLYLYRRE